MTQHRKTIDEMTEDYYQKLGVKKDFVRNDDRAFGRIKKDSRYKDIRVDVLRELGFKL